MNVNFTQFPYGKYVLVLCFAGFVGGVSHAQNAQNAVSTPQPAPVATVAVAKPPAPAKTVEKPTTGAPQQPKNNQQKDGIIIDIIDITRQD